MDYEFIGGEVGREVLTLQVLELQLAADVLGQPARDLHPADVLADGVVGAGLRHQHPVAGAQGADGDGPLHQDVQVALQPGEEDGERGQRHLVGGCRPPPSGRPESRSPRGRGGRLRRSRASRSSRSLTTRAVGVVVQGRRGWSALAGGSSGPWAPPCRWARPARPSRPAAASRRRSSPDAMNSSGATRISVSRISLTPSPFRAETLTWAIFRAARASGTPSGGAARVGLVEGHDHRDAQRPELADKLLLERPPAPGRHHDGDVGALHDLAAFADAGGAEGPLVVDPGGVDEQHRPERAASPWPSRPGRWWSRPRRTVDATRSAWRWRLSKDDLPTFRRPKMPICNLMPFGVLIICRNLGCPSCAKGII